MTSTRTDALTAPDAERGVVASCLLDPDAVPGVLSIVDPGDFTDEVAGAAMAVIHHAHVMGHRIDVELLVSELRLRGGHAADRAVTFLVDARADFVTGAHAVYHARRVAEAARKRRLHDLAVDVRKQSLNGAASGEIIESLCTRAAELAAVCSDKPDPWTAWRESIEEFDRQTYIPVADANSQLARFPLAREHVTVLGGREGAGKTAAAMQFLVDAMILDPELRVAIANVEVPPHVLLDRTVSRLAGVPYSVVRDRTYRGERREAVLAAADDLVGMRDRLHWISGPYTTQRVRAQAAAVGADVVCMDYLQRFTTGIGASADLRQQTSAVMTDARAIADDGRAVLLLSALSREGRLRESSEVEYGADWVGIIEPVEGEHDGPRVPMTLRCMKNRHGPREDIEATFDGSLQEWTGEPEGPQPWDI